MASDRCNFFFPFWAIFCPFIPIKAQKNKISKGEKEKTHGDIIILNKCTINYDHIICYTVPEILCVTDVICVFHFWLYFVFLPP